MAVLWRMYLLMKQIHILVTVEADFIGIAIAAEQLLNPLLLLWQQLPLPTLVPEERGLASQIVGQFRAHGGNVPCQHIVKYVAETDGYPHLLDRVELRALAPGQYVGQDTLVIHSPLWSTQVDLIAHTLVLAWTLCNVTYCPVVGYLSEIKILFHIVSFVKWCLQRYEKIR